MRLRCRGPPPRRPPRTSTPLSTARPTPLRSCLTSVNTADDDQVQPRAPEQETPPLGIDPIPFVEPQDAVRPDRPQRPRTLLQGLRVRAGDDEGHPLVQEREEELVLVPVREDVL